MSTIKVNALENVAGTSRLSVESCARASFKNKIINGGFDIWQRGTSFTPATAYGYTADRARLSYSGTAGDTTTNITKQTATVDGKFVNVLRHSILTTTSTRQVRYDHRLETPTYLTNQTVTLSFWVKASRTVALDGGSSCGDNGTGNLTPIPLSLGNATTAWTRKTATFTLGDCSVSSYLDIIVGHTTDGSNVDIDYAMFQLEEGSVATDFEQRPIGMELSLCQRYYQRFVTNKPNGELYSHARVQSSVAQTYVTGAVPFKVPMRTSPTVTIPRVFVNGVDYASGWNLYGNGLNGGYGGIAIYNYIGAMNGGIIAFDAIADAEL